MIFIVNTMCYCYHQGSISEWHAFEEFCQYIFVLQTDNKSPEEVRGLCLPFEHTQSADKKGINNVNKSIFLTLLLLKNIIQEIMAL